MQFDFLMCSERSGSNLITKVMDGHPEFCGPFPSHVTRTFCHDYCRYCDLADDANWRALGYVCQFGPSADVEALELSLPDAARQDRPLNASEQARYGPFAEARKELQRRRATRTPAICG
ncbi:MAG: hypothetical protein HQ559_09570 [Lentisphaerae bacterium]|nr:hypothetical protein [Lentisphaerota bacterium]